MIEKLIPKEIRNNYIEIICEIMDKSIYKTLAELENIENSINPKLENNAFHDDFKILYNVNFDNKEKEKIIFDIRNKYKGRHTLKDYENELSELFGFKIILVKPEIMKVGAFKVGSKLYTNIYTNVIELRGLNNKEFVKNKFKISSKINKKLTYFSDYAYKIHEYIRLKKQANIYIKIIYEE